MIQPFFYPPLIQILLCLPWLASSLPRRHTKALLYLLPVIHNFNQRLHRVHGDASEGHTPLPAGPAATQPRQPGQSQPGARSPSRPAGTWPGLAAAGLGSHVGAPGGGLGGPGGGRRCIPVVPRRQLSNAERAAAAKAFSRRPRRPCAGSAAAAPPCPRGSARTCGTRTETRRRSGQSPPQWSVAGGRYCAPVTGTCETRREGAGGGGGGGGTHGRGVRTITQPADAVCLSGGAGSAWRCTVTRPRSRRQKGH